MIRANKGVIVLFLATAIIACKKLVYRPAEIHVHLEGYNFTATDSIDVSFYSLNYIFQHRDRYAIAQNKELTIRATNFGPYSYDHVIITNADHSIRDTLKNFVFALDGLSGSINAYKQVRVGFTMRNQNYEPESWIELTIKR